MSRLHYRTRSDSDIARRRRIFITGHPADRQEIARITDSILDCVECTVYFYEFDGLPLSDKQLENDLSDMNAVVFVVSAGILFSKRLHSTL